MELESGFYITAEIWETSVREGGIPSEELGEERMEKGSHGLYLGDFIQLCWRRVNLQTSEGGRRYIRCFRNRFQATDKARILGSGLHCRR